MRQHYTQQLKQRSSSKDHHYASTTSTKMGQRKSSHPGTVIETMGSEKQISETLVIPSTTKNKNQQSNDLNSELVDKKRQPKKESKKIDKADEKGQEQQTR